MEPIMIYQYMYTNDMIENHDWPHAEGYFTGTQKQFDEFIEDEQKNYGMEYWDLKIRPATEKEIQDAKKYWGEDCFD